MYCQDAHIVSDMWWHPKLLHQCLYKLDMTTSTCQVYSTTTILQVWDTNYDQWTKRQWTVNSSHCPPHSGPLCLLWAVHGQSLHGLPYKRTGSSSRHSEGRLVDMTLPFCRNTSYTEHKWVVTVNICQQTGCVEVQVQMSLYKTSHVGHRDIPVHISK